VSIDALQTYQLVDSYLRGTGSNWTRDS